jgi:peptidoglycan/LPS O-acetylase OafA/YrhL
VKAAENAAHFPRVGASPIASLGRRRRIGIVLVSIVLALALPAAAFAHDQPETKQSRWVMTDWMMDTFFIFAGLALVAFLAAWKAGHFQELDTAGSIPLYVHEEDYYTPEWAYDDEEWTDAER